MTGAMTGLTDQKNEAIIKALENEFDYVCNICVKDDSYVLYPSKRAFAAPPEHASGNYTRAVQFLNDRYVVPEDRERVTASMQVEHVVKKLEDQSEYVIYAAVCEEGGRYYKKFRFCYLDEKKETLVLLRVDVSDIVRAQMLREQEEKRHRTFLENMPVVCFVCSVLLRENGKPYDFQYTYSNRVHAEMMGMDCGDLLGKRFYADLQETDRRWLGYYYETAWLGIPHIIRDHNPKTGRTYIIHTFQEQEGSCSGIAMDITEAFFLEQELEKTREHMRHVLKATTDLVFQYNLERDSFAFIKTDKERADRTVQADKFISEMVRRGYLDEEYEAAIRDALKKMRGGAHEIYMNIRARKRLRSPLQWYKLALFDYQEVKTHERCVLGYMQNIEQIQTRQEILKREAQSDPLTGIFNAREGSRRVREYLMNRKGPFYSALFILDIDDFKGFNDTLGHQSGDETLKAFAQLLQHTFRSEDIVYRLGGDEFVVFVERLLEPEKVIGSIMERFFQNVSQVKIGGIGLSSSVGVFATSRECTFEQYYSKADKALYETKHNGKNWYTLILEN